MLTAAAGILPAAPCVPSGELRIPSVFALRCADAVRQDAGQDGQNARAPQPLLLANLVTQTPR